MFPGQWWAGPSPPHVMVPPPSVVAVVRVVTALTLTFIHRARLSPCGKWFECKPKTATSAFSL